MTAILARRWVRVVLTVVFVVSMATSVLNLFLAGPVEIGIPTAIGAAIIGGLLNVDPRRKR